MERMTRESMRLAWYERGFRDGWESAIEEVREAEQEDDRAQIF